MKKIILTLAIIVSTLCAFAADENVNPKVLNAFTTDFQTAKEVEWAVGSNFYRAAFIYNDKHLFAFYNTDGSLLSLTRYLSPTDLSLNLQIDLKKKYADYWVSDLFEMAKNEETIYYITVENADSRIVLKSADNNSWNVLKRIKKI